MDTEPAGHHVWGQPCSASLRSPVLQKVYWSLDVSDLSWAKARLSQYVPFIGPSSGPYGHRDQATRPLHDCSLLHFLILVGTSGPSPSLPHLPMTARVPALLQIQRALALRYHFPAHGAPKETCRLVSVFSTHTPIFHRTIASFLSGQANWARAYFSSLPKNAPGHMLS